MKEKIVVINQKGGVGKSTTAHAIGAGLRARKERVLYVDLDAQCNLSQTLGAVGEGATILDLIGERMPEEGRREIVQAAVQHLPVGDLLPATSTLAAADINITGVGKEHRLAEVLACFEEDYDYIVIDTPPALGILTVNALTAATGAVIPAQADTYSLQGIGQLYDTIEAVRAYTNPNLRVLGIVLTRYNNRAILNREVAESMDEAAQMMGTKLYKTSIRECIALREAQASQTDIFSYAPRSNASADYIALLREMLPKAASAKKKPKAAKG